MGHLVAYSYPLMLDVSRRQIVIVGAGVVAARKAGGLIDAGATRLRVVAPEVTGAFVQYAAIEFIRETYRPEHLANADLVFAATDKPAVNDAVVRDARERGIFVCRADSDDQMPGDFITPAKFVNGPVMVTVSAGSPALAALVRDAIEQSFDPRWSMLARAMETLRPEILASGRSIDQRRAMFRALASHEGIAILEKEGLDGLRAWIKRTVSEPLK